MTTEAEQQSMRSLLLPLAGLVACVFLWPALLTFDLGDWPSPNQYPHHPPSANACGMVGAWFAYHLRYLLGDGAFPLLLFATMASTLRLARGTIHNRWERLGGLMLVIVCVSASVHLLASSDPAALPVGHGGLVGFAIGEVMARNLSSLGTFIVLSASLCVGLLFVTDGWVLKIPSAMRQASQATSAAVVHRVSAILPRMQTTAIGDVSERTSKTAADRAKSARRKSKRRRDEDEDPTRFDEQDYEKDSIESEGEDTSTAQDMPEEDESDATEEAYDAESEVDEGEPDAPPPLPSRERRRLPIVKVASRRQVALAEPYPRQIENWQLPSLKLLEEPEYNFSAQQESVVREQAMVLEQTLEEFRLDARVVEIDTGPVITMFELKLGAGIKVSQIASLSNDIARALKAHAIRIVAPISGKNTVGVEVPNVTKERVRMRELLAVAGKRASEMNLPLFLGKDAGGEALVVDLTKMPHLLIAGTTGSGKSVCINAIVLSLLMTKRPDHVKLICIDPKMVEMTQFKDMPHLMCPLVTDMAQAEKILEWAVSKMDERYEILAEARVKDIGSYNRLGQEKLFARLKPTSDEERARIIVRLPYIVIIIDELADLMMTSAKEVEHHLSRLAQKSRAVGIHIIVATQRPEAKVVTGLIKSNLPSRICFRVSSRMDSRIVLDQNGGEVLLGQGDMLMLPPGSHKLIRAQGTFLGEDEVQHVLDDLADRAKPEFHPELTRLRTAGAGALSSVRDPLFDKAVRVIIDSKRGSVSLLQRRLTVGYSRASRLIDQMAEAGIVGEYKGSQAREVNMTLEDWNAVRTQMTADEKAGYEADAEDDVAGCEEKASSNEDAAAS